MTESWTGPPLLRKATTLGRTEGQFSLVEEEWQMEGGVGGCTQ
jgi:hypothetical protein